MRCGVLSEKRETGDGCGMRLTIKPEKYLPTPSEITGTMSFSG